LQLTNIEALPTPAGFSQKFAFAVHKGQPDLLSKLNEGLAITKANGTYDFFMKNGLVFTSLNKWVCATY